MSGAGAGAMSGISAGAVPPYEMQRDPRRGCGSASPFTPGIGYSSAKGYQYSVPRTEVVGQSRQKGFSLKDFALQAISGGITGGVASAAFYGAGKGIEKLRDNFRLRKSSSNTGKYQKANLWERITKRKADVNELHANPLDEFSNPKIGPCESAVSKYIKQINQTGKLTNPIEV